MSKSPVQEATGCCNANNIDFSEPKYRNEQWLRHQYIHLQKSAKGIAREFDYGSTTINEWLEKHDIQKRSVGEQISISQQKDKKHYDEAWLKEKYHDEKLTIPEMAKIVDVGVHAIRNGMEENDIERRTGAESQRKRGPWCDESWLRKHYVKIGKSAPEIAEEFDVSTTIIYERLDDYDIERRTSGSKGKKWKDQRKHTKEEYLREEYVEKNRTGSEIAEECGVSCDVIYHWMDKHGIDRKNRYVGENAPNWKGGHASDYGSNWKRQRDKARARDNNTCQDCGHEWQEGEIRLDVHHIIPLKEFDVPEEANDLDNLITLCRECHKKWEGIPLRPL